jgi:hypothetical protein
MMKKASEGPMMMGTRQGKENVGVGLAIDVDLVRRSQPPAKLVERLNQKSLSPTKTPQMLERSVEKAHSLREAHLLEVKTRASREAQRVREVRLAKERLEMSKIEKTRRRLFECEAHAIATKEDHHEMVAAKSLRRSEHATAVANAREAQRQFQLLRSEELQAAEARAAEKRHKNLQAVVDKSASVCKKVHPARLRDTERCPLARCTGWAERLVP